MRLTYSAGKNFQTCIESQAMEGRSRAYRPGFSRYRDGMESEMGDGRQNWVGYLRWRFVCWSWI